MTIDKHTFRFGLFLVTIVGTLLLGGTTGIIRRSPAPRPLASTTNLSIPPAQYLAALDVARVFGRTPACAEANPGLITTIANEAVDAKLDPRVLAAVVAVESGCNQWATSARGAVGLTQVVPRLWMGTYDFESRYNLLNPKDSIHVGALILSGLIKQYGPVNGLRRYNGLGTTSPDYDAGYTDKVAALAARHIPLS